MKEKRSSEVSSVSVAKPFLAGPSLSGVANRLVALEEFGAAEPVG